MLCKPVDFPIFRQLSQQTNFVRLQNSFFPVHQTGSFLPIFIIFPRPVYRLCLGQCRTCCFRGVIVPVLERFRGFLLRPVHSSEAGRCLSNPKNQSPQLFCETTEVQDRVPSFCDGHTSSGGFLGPHRHQGCILLPVLICARHQHFLRFAVGMCTKSLWHYHLALPRLPGSSPKCWIRLLRC